MRIEELFDQLWLVMDGVGRPYVLAVAEYTPEGAWFHVKLGKAGDKEVVRALKLWLSKEAGAEWPEEAKQPMKDLWLKGAAIALAYPSERGRWDGTFLFSDKAKVSADHQLLDIVCEVSVEWSNANHEGKYVWHRPAEQPADAPVHA